MAQPPPRDRDPGDEPGRDEGLPGEGQPGGGPDAESRDPRLSGFARDGEWDLCAPGPELVAVLAEVGGPEWRCPGAEPEELIGVLRRVAAVESWAAAAKLGVIRELIRQDDLPIPGRPRRGGPPGQWSDSLTHELALALATSAQSADKTIWTACELEARLPGTGLLLADGTLTLPKARLIAETFQGLSDQDAARAEEQLLPQLTGPTGKTFTQVERLAAAIAAEVDPGLAERQRKNAERERSRVQMFRERSGTAALSGRDLPTDDTLAAYANVNARTEEYKTSGAFPGTRMDQLRATAYLDLLNAVTADARIAHATAQAETKAETEPEAKAEAEPEAQAEDQAGSGTEAEDQAEDQAESGTEAAGADPGMQAAPAGQAGPGDRPGTAGGSCDCSRDECDGGCGDPGDDSPDDGDGAGRGPGDDGPGDDDPHGDGPDGDGPDGADRGDHDDSGPGADGPGDDGPLGRGPEDPDLDLDPDLDPELAARPAVADLVIPLLLCSAWRSGPVRGTASAPSTRTCAVISPRSPPVGPAANGVSRSPTPTASRSAMDAPSPPGPPGRRPQAGAHHRTPRRLPPWPHSQPGST
jgi:hypothetical protein